jgi:hypothetical protein
MLLTLMSNNMKLFLLLYLSFILSSNGQNVPEASNQIVPLSELKNVHSFAYNACAGVFYGLNEKDEVQYVVITDINERDKITFVNAISGGKRTTTLNFQVGNKTTVESLSEQELLQLKNNKITRFQLSKKLSESELSDIAKNCKNIEGIMTVLTFPKNP